MLITAFSFAFLSCEKEDVSDFETNENNKIQVSSGLGGSMAQFTIIDNYLYTVDYKSLKVFLISDPLNPELLETIDLGIGIETIFPQNDYLFIGTQSGVRIYSVENPRSPVEVSEFSHVTSCDPVVANDDYAIATLRGGTACGGNLNQFDIIDISDINNPSLVTSEMLVNPYGLGFSSTDENIIFICDGYAGLKIYDISNPMEVSLIGHIEELEATDVISTPDNLVVLTRQGVYQFDASNPEEMVQKSFVPVQ